MLNWQPVSVTLSEGSRPSRMSAIGGCYVNHVKRVALEAIFDFVALVSELNSVVNKNNWAGGPCKHWVPHSIARFLRLSGRAMLPAIRSSSHSQRLATGQTFSSPVHLSDP
jgi:hypothetical protein